MTWKGNLHVEMPSSLGLTLWSDSTEPGQDISGIAGAYQDDYEYHTAMHR